MAKYAISAEGAASMRALAKQLYTELMPYWGHLPL